jgi:hypothetical protein
VIEIVVSVDPVFQGQVAEDVRGLRDEDLPHGIAKGLRHLFFLLVAVLVGHRLGPDVGSGASNWFGLKKRLLLQKKADRVSDGVERNHAEVYSFLIQFETVLQNFRARKKKEFRGLNTFEVKSNGLFLK